jgi:SAM-dependent methyltransferase
MSDAHAQNLAYWLRRHEEFEGDIRSVGNRGKSPEENEADYWIKTRKLVSILRRELATPRGKRVLDLGCGTGLYAPALTKLGIRYTGADISPVALCQARARCPAGEFVQSDILNLRLPNLHFDAVMAVDVLCHVTDDAAWRKAIAMIAGLVKRGALGIIIDRIEAQRVQYKDYVLHRTLADYEGAFSSHDMWLEHAQPRCFLVRMRNGVER